MHCAEAADLVRVRQIAVVLVVRKIKVTTRIHTHTQVREFCTAVLRDTWSLTVLLTSTNRFTFTLTHSVNERAGEYMVR